MKIETYIRCTGAQGTPVDASNLPTAVNPPILCLGMSAELKIHFFDGEALEQMDAEAFEDIGSWRLSVDTDYSQATEPILRWTTGISVDEDGTVLVAIPNVSSDKLVAALGVKQSGEYIAELMGYAAGQAVPSFVVQFPFNVYNRIDLEGGSESIPVSSGYYTNSQVDALLASAYEFQFSADGESWHDTQAGTDRWFRLKNGSVSGAQWSDPIAIPAGRDGVDGQDGQDGQDGVSPVISVGTVSTGSAGTPASVTSRVSSGGTMYLDFTIPRGSDGSGTVGSGNLIFTSGGTQVATYNAQTNSDVEVPLPSGGSGTVGSGNLIFTSGGTQVASFNAQTDSDVTVPLPTGGGGSGAIVSAYELPQTPQADTLYIIDTNAEQVARYYTTQNAFIGWGIGSSCISVVNQNGDNHYFGGLASMHVYARHNPGMLTSSGHPSNGLYWTYWNGISLMWSSGAAGSSAHSGAAGAYSACASAYPWSDPPVAGYVNGGYILAPLGTNWRLVYNSGTQEDPETVELGMGPEASASYAGEYGGDFGSFRVEDNYTSVEIYARPENTIGAIMYGASSAAVTSRVAQLSGIIPIPTVGSANLIFTSGGTQVATFNANATSNVTLALPEGGGSSAQAITVIPTATTSYTLSEGHFTHIPASATTYALPAVDNTHEHEIVLDVKFDNVQTIVFHDNSGNIVTPQDEITIAAADVWRFLCQWNTLLSCWCIMPIPMTDNTIYTPSLSISPSSYTISGTAGSALTSLDLSSGVTVAHPTSGGSATFSSLDLPAGVTITSAGVISGTPASAGVTSSTITVAYTGATAITCAAVFDIAAAPAPTPIYYYTVSGATATPAANGDYYVHSGTHGSPGVVYTNGTYYMFDASDCWVIHDSASWAPEGLGPQFASILHSSEGAYATVPTGTWTNGADMPSDEATVSTYGA